MQREASVITASGQLTAARSARLDQLSHVLLAHARHTSGGVLRVAVTGITASGKSTLAAELVERILALGTPCFRVPVDGFHNPRAIRYRRGRESAEGYYRDAYDYALLTDCVLQPLGPGGDRRYTVRGFDIEADARVEDPRIEAPLGSIGILDASFLLRPELRDTFDYSIFVHTSFEEAESRGVRRDAAALGGEEQARRLYRTRYHEAQRIYLREAQPLKHADALFVNDDPSDPSLFLQHGATRSTPAQTRARSDWATRPRGG
jgi:uridine kinase